VNYGVRLTRPTRGQLDRYLEQAERRPLTYHPGGLTDGPAPEGYYASDNTIEIGRGPESFEQAVQALRSWKMLDIPWVVHYPDSPVIRLGLTVVVSGRTHGLWTLNPTRIVRIVEDDDLFSFAYGTVTGHAASGEERFEIRMGADDAVTYRLTAYSRLRHPLARLAPPVARRTQRRFAAASLRAMQDALRTTH